MRKSSPHSSRDNKPGSRGSFKKDDGRKSYSKDAKPSYKKNYDGRSASSGDDRPSGPARPYSGRVAGGSDRPAGKPFRKDSQPGNRDGAGRAPRNDFGKPGSARRGPFDGNDNREGRGDRQPRKEFDKPRRESDSRPFRDRPKKNFDSPADDHREGRGAHKPRKEFDRPRADRGSRPFGEGAARNSDKPSFKNSENRDRGAGKPRNEFAQPRKATDSRPFRDRPKTDGGKKAFNKEGDNKAGEIKPVSPSFRNVMDQAFNQPKSKKNEGHEDDIVARPQQFEDQVFGELADAPAEDRPKRPFEKKANPNKRNTQQVHDQPGGRKKKYRDDDDDDDEIDRHIDQKDGPRLEMPLNKFIAHSGECSRRDAAELVRQGKVKVNGELVLDPGYRVKHDDKVTMSGKKLTPQKGMVYILLNKPKGFITTNDDPQGRKTVMQLVANAGVDRLFPVGRLDRDTSGLLLITNDGDLTQKLSHPSYGIKKVYQVTLDRALTNADFEKILAGLDLEDGIAKVDALAYLEKKNELGLEIHSGRNRIVRRIFESLGYVVEKLDRVMYAGLTKKNLPRSKWRFLDEREVVLLKHFKS